MQIDTDNIFWEGGNVIYNNNNDKNDWLDSEMNSEIKREKKSTLRNQEGANNKQTEGITKSRGTQQGTKRKSEFKDSVWKLWKKETSVWRPIRRQGKIFFYRDLNYSTATERVYLINE